MWQAQSGETNGSTESNLKAAISATERTNTPEKSSHTMVKQITVEELFGLSLPKDPSLPAMPSQSTTTAPSDPSIHNQSYPTPAQQNLRSNQLRQAPGLLPASYALHPSPVFHSAPRPDPQPRCSGSPLVVPPASSEPRDALPGPTAASVSYLGQEILSTLKPAMPSVNSDIHKPVLAPNFLPSALVPPHSFQEPMGKPLLQHNKDMDVFSQPPNLIKPVSAVPVSPAFAVPGPEISVLLSPSAFQQSNKTTTVASSVALPNPTESSTSVGAVESPPAPCSKTQLQETLIHLIKNDPDFLSAIHDAYLQTLSKDFNSMKL